MSAPVQRFQRSPPVVFPTETDFEKFKPLLERYLKEWFTFITSVKGSTSAGIGGISEAPQDGQDYARKNAAWTVIVGGGGGVVSAAGVAQYTLSSNSLTINSIHVTSTAVVFVFYQNIGSFGALPGVLRCASKVIGTSFTVEQINPMNGTALLNDMTIGWVIVEP